MTKLIIINDTPTLRALDQIMASEKPRYSNGIGMGELGGECKRRLWYKFRWAKLESPDALSQRRFADGHASEDIMASRLRLVKGVNLSTHTPSGGQHGFSHFGGHLKGFLDGKIIGIKEAPKTKHVWEHKCVNEAKWRKLKKLVDTIGEKNALREWDDNYFVQAIEYMYFEGFTRHYLTVNTPGSRDHFSVRTDADDVEARWNLEKCEDIIFGEGLPGKAATNPSKFVCKFCPFKDQCHKGADMMVSCRTCKHSKPTYEGKWYCNQYKKNIPLEHQKTGCSKFYEQIEQC
tara:strand:- start:3633 stop:4502 length:870 start_codon:yes stop_codon:yes gene_type:complete